MGRYFDFNMEIVAGDDHTISMTWKTAAGAAVNVSSWAVYYHAEQETGGSTDTITVAPGSVTTSDSGTGTVDTFNIPLTDTITDVDKGYYTQEVAILRSTLIETVARGTLTVTERLTTVA